MPKTGFPITFEREDLRTLEPEGGDKTGKHGLFIQQYDTIATMPIAAT
jgi:hypothetical protein